MDTVLLPKIVTAFDLGVKTLTLIFIIVMVVYQRGQNKYNDLKFETVEKTADKSDERSKNAIKISKRSLKISNELSKESKETNEKLSVIGQKVEELHTGWTELIEDKHGDKKEINT